MHQPEKLQTFRADAQIGLRLEVRGDTRRRVPYASMVRTFLEPTSSNHPLISSKEKVPPSSEFTSILTEKINAGVASSGWDLPRVPG